MPAAATSADQAARGNADGRGFLHREMRWLFRERIQVRGEELGVRSVPGNAKSGAAAPDRLADPSLASDDDAGIVAPRSTRQRGLEDAGDVFDIAWIDS
jgi:hypothetical protein